MKEKKLEEKIAILVPMYNAERFIARCLKSILDQTYKNIEIIVINDGSSDSSLEICKEMAESDERISVYSRENKGVAITRNELIEKCNSKYLLFLDSDDFIDADYVQTLYELMKKYNSDMAACNLYFYSDKKKINKQLKQGADEKELETKEAFKKLLYQYEIQHGPTCKLYKKELFEGIKFPEGKTYEDLATIYKIVHRCNKVAITSYQGYNYVYNEEGITKNIFKESDLFMLTCGEEIFKFTEQNYGEDLKLASENLLITQCIHLAIKIPLDSKYKEEIRKIKKYIKQYRKELLNDEETYPRLKAFLFSSFFGIRAIKLTNSMIELSKKIRKG